MATSHDLMATSQQKMTDFIGQKLDLQRLGELREMHAFYKGVGEDEAAADIMVQMKQILDYQKQRAEEGRLEHAKKRKKKKEWKKKKKQLRRIKKQMMALLLLLRYKDEVVHLLLLKVN
jgi:hypothetical protein